MAQNIPIVVADVELQLSTAISVGATSFSVASANDDDGNALPAGKYCFTIDNGKSNKEYLIGQLNGLNVTSVVSVSRQGVESAGASEKHRIGSSCIITDFATIQRVADTLRGVVALNGATPIVYDAEPTLADRKELATVGYVLDTATGGTVNFDAQTISATAGEDIVDGNLVYFKTSDQEWYKTDADTAATVEGVQLGIALGTGSDGVAITGGVLINGIYTTTGLTAGSEYYASNTGGAYSTSAGTIAVPIGIALSTTKLLKYASTAASYQNAVMTGFVQMYTGTSAPSGYLFCDGAEVSRTTYVSLFGVISTSYGIGNGTTTFNIPDLRGSFFLGSGTRTRVMTFDGASAVEPSTDTITVTSNNWLHTGQAVALTGSSLPTGLTAGTYYVIRTSATAIKLAVDVANANAGDAVDITADGSGTCTLTQTLTSRSVGDTGGEETHALTDAEMPSHIHNIYINSGGAGTNSNLPTTTADFQNNKSGAEYIVPSGSDAPHNIMPPYGTGMFIIKY